MREFKTGATRNNDDNKLDYEGFLSPLVLKRYAEYMNKHRLQEDGSLRDSDNWQLTYGEDHYAICMKSLTRHFMDIWLHQRGEGEQAQEDLETALCAVLFNTNSYLFKLLKDKSYPQDKI